MRPFRSMPADEQARLFLNEIDTSKQALENRPDELAPVIAFGQRLLRYAAYEISRGATREAEDALVQALSLLRDALQRQGPDYALLEILSKTLAASGALYAAHGDPDLAAKCLEDAVECDAALYNEQPTPVRVKNLIRSSERCGELHYERGAFEAARGQLSQAVALRRRHVEEVEDLATEFQDGALCLVKLGKAHVAVGAVPEGLECFRVAEGMLRTLVERLGRGGATKYNLAGVLEESGDAFYSQGEFEQAKHAYDQAANQLRELFEQEPGNRDWLLGFSSLMKKAGQAARSADDQAQAVDALQLALELERLALQQAPEDIPVRESLAETLLALADAHDAAGLLLEARDYYQDALELRRALLDEAPEQPRRIESLASALHDLGELLRRASRYDEALPWFREALELKQRLAELAPERPNVQRSLAMGHGVMAGVCMMLEDLTGAVSYHAAAQELTQALLERFPEDPAYRFDWAFGLVNQAQLHRICGAPAPALEDLDRAVAYAEELATARPNNPEYGQLAARLLKDREWLVKKG